MFTKLKLYITILIIGFIFSSCQSTTQGSSNNKQQKTYKEVNPQCRIAKSQHQICLGNCMMVTPGSFLTVMGKCGNSCSRQSMQVAAMCNR